MRRNKTKMADLFETMISELLAECSVHASAEARQPCETEKEEALRTQLCLLHPDDPENFQIRRNNSINNNHRWQTKHAR